MEFNRIIKLLRKERGITQKQAAEDLGVSQALLSHYEKGIRECGLDFVVRVADYYNVSCDYLLGRSAERNGMMLSAEDIPNPDKMKDNIYHCSVLPTMNKKLISNSLNVLYAKIGQCHSKALTTETLLSPVLVRRMQAKLWQALYFNYDYTQLFLPQLERNLNWLNGEIVKLTEYQKIQNDKSK